MEEMGQALEDDQIGVQIQEAEDGLRIGQPECSFAPGGTTPTTALREPSGSWHRWSSAGAGRRGPHGRPVPGDPTPPERGRALPHGPVRRGRPRGGRGLRRTSSPWGPGPIPTTSDGCPDGQRAHDQPPVGSASSPSAERSSAHGRGGRMTSDAHLRLEAKIIVRKVKAEKRTSVPRLLRRHDDADPLLLHPARRDVEVAKLRAHGPRPQSFVVTVRSMGKPAFSQATKSKPYSNGCDAGSTCPRG